jgi:hypothetical protein
MKSRTGAVVPIVGAFVVAGSLAAEAAVPREEVWVADVSVKSDTRTQAVAADSQGNTYVAGVASDGVTYTRFLQKLNGAGAQLWRFAPASSSPYEIIQQQLIVDEIGGVFFVLRTTMVDVSRRYVYVSCHSLVNGLPMWEAPAVAAAAPGETARTAAMGLGNERILWVARQVQTSFPGGGLRWSIQYRKLSADTGSQLEEGVLAGSATTDRYLFDLAAANDRLFVAYREEGPADFDLVVTAYSISAGSLVVVNPHEPTPCSAAAPCRQELQFDIPASTSGTATFSDGIVDASGNFVLAGYYEWLELDDCSPECFGDTYRYYPVVVKADRDNHIVFQTIEPVNSAARFTSGDTPSSDIAAGVTAGSGGSLFVLLAGEPGGGELVELASNGVRVDSRLTETYFSESFSGGGCSQWTPVWQPRAVTASAGRLVMTGQLRASCSTFPTDLDTSRTAWFAPAAPASYFLGVKAPACLNTSTTCDSGMLLTGRAAIAGGLEPNQPNTLSGLCADGSAGTFHVNESIDRIRVFTSEGRLQQGRRAWVDVTVFAPLTFADDSLDIFYAPNVYQPTGWTFVTTLKPTRPGLQTLRTSYILPPGYQQAVRAQFRRGGTNAVCAPGSYNDRDDLVFTVTDVARIDTALRAPRCSRLVSACDSGMLLNGRGTTAGGVEPNQPNTLGGTCADGSSGSLLDGSIDRIRVLTRFPTNPSPGTQVLVWADVRINSTDDRLDFYYAANAAAPDWKFLRTLEPERTGLQSLSALHSLPAGSLQAVRASLRRADYAPASCPVGPFNDHDDLVFAVGQ